METYSFGEWLKQRREYLRLTQREVAASVHCSVAMLKKIEADERRPSPELAYLLAASLNVPEPDKAIFIEVARGERPVDTLWHIRDDATVPTSSFRVPLPLPKSVTPFIGRVDETHEIGTRLTNPECRLLVLIGPGGVGKTRLALTVADAQQAHFADGVAFVSLAALTDTESIAGAVARSLRLVLNGPPTDQVMAFLHRRNLLLILDNCEQLQGDFGWLSDLLTYAPRVKVLATSRERLQLTEEWVYIVPELAQAATLFRETARRVKQDFNVVAEAADVNRICQLVDNLPLAVELAASWTPLMSCAQIADHIERDLTILSTEVRNIPERHRSIRAVFDHSWDLLSASEQNALMRLAVFRGGWQAEQALIVADADLLLLRRLVDKSLIRVGEQSRYDLHELIRQYVAQKLGGAGREVETRQRHFDAYLALATHLDTQQFQPSSMSAVLRFDQEQDNIHTALDWSMDNGRTETTLQLLYHLWFYWFRRGHYHEGSEWALRVIRHGGDLENVYLCITLSSAAILLFLQGHYSEADPLAARALTMARRLEDTEALIRALGTYTFTSATIEQALTGVEEAITLIQETGKAQEALPMAYLSAATWFHSSGRSVEAEDYYRKSILQYRQHHMVDFMAEPLGRLGQLALEKGNLQDAYALTIESMIAAQTAGYDVVFGAWGSVRLGVIQLYLGEVDIAQQTLEQALLLFEDGQDVRVKQEALAVLSEVALARGDVQAATTYLQLSLDICEMLFRQLETTSKLDGTPEALPVDLITLCARAARVTCAQGNHERAATLYGIADALSVQSGHSLLPHLQAHLEQSMVIVRAALSEDAFNSSLAKGKQLSLTEAFVFLLN